MRFTFGHWIRHSELLGKDALEAMLSQGQVLEQDAHGIKVVRTAEGDILKIFRVKHLVSSARVYSYARQFCRNADRLQVLGVPTVEIRHLYHLEDGQKSAVLYKPLAGDTIRQLAQSRQLDAAALAQLGSFIAQLHRLGVYFRSLHLGNIIMTPEQKLGLIDVADMSIYPWGLGKNRIRRNFQHFCRLRADLELLGVQGVQAILNQYALECDLADSTLLKLMANIRKLVVYES